MSWPVKPRKGEADKDKKNQEDDPFNNNFPEADFSNEPRVDGGFQEGGWGGNEINEADQEGGWGGTSIEPKSIEQKAETEEERKERLVRDFLKNKNQTTIGLAACGVSGLMTAGYAYVPGAILGGVYGFMDVQQSGGTLRDPYWRGRVLNRMSSTGRQFGMVLGTYTVIKCSMGVMRGKQDIINTFSAGFIVGSLEALKTRSPPKIVMQGKNPIHLFECLNSLYLIFSDNRLNISSLV